MQNLCMIVQDANVKGGIAAVTNGYRGSELEKNFNITYIESYRNGSKKDKLLKALKSYFQFCKLFAINRPDIVHIHSSFGPSFYRKIPFIYIAAYFKVPIINHIHGADFEKFYTQASQLKRNLIKRVYNKCSKIIALSEEWKDYLKIVVDENKVSIINNYSNVNKDAYKKRINKGNTYKVLFLGEIGRRKGCYDIPKVIQNVVSEIPNVKFILAGSGEIENIKKIVVELGIEKNIEFPGWVRGEKKDELLRECDIFFLPSYNEGMPMSILDAMGYGLPIISTDVGAISKLVINNKNGFLFKAGDIDGYSKAIRKLLLDSKKMKEFSKNSVDLVYDKYSFEKHLSILEKEYMSLRKEM